MQSKKKLSFNFATENEIVGHHHTGIFDTLELLDTTGVPYQHLSICCSLGLFVCVCMCMCLCVKRLGDYLIQTSKWI